MSNSLSLLAQPEPSQESTQGGLLKKVAVSVLGGAVALAAAGAGARLAINTHEAHQETAQQKAADAAIAKGISLKATVPSDKGLVTLDATYPGTSLSPFRLSDPKGIPFKISAFEQTPQGSTVGFADGTKVPVKWENKGYYTAGTGTLSFGALERVVEAQQSGQADTVHSR